MRPPLMCYWWVICGRQPLPSGEGENAGRTLKESNIVLWLHDLGRWNGRPREFEMSVSRLPENVTNIAVLVQSAGQGAILGAVAQPLR